MSCSPLFPTELWETAQRDLASRPCPHCGASRWEGGETPCPLITHILVHVTCTACHRETTWVVSPDGEVYRTDASSLDTQT